jgi:hypothetical protein
VLRRSGFLQELRATRMMRRLRRGFFSGPPPPDVVGARTSNASLKKLCGKTTVADLIALTSTDKQHVAKDRCIAFQTGVLVTDGVVNATLRPRTLEESIVYENFKLLRSGTLSIGILIPALLSDVYQEVYERIKSDSFKKTDFAMDILAYSEEWIVPEYIAEGLRWIEERLSPLPAAVAEAEDTVATGE